MFIKPQFEFLFQCPKSPTEWFKWERLQWLCHLNLFSNTASFKKYSLSANLMCPEKHLQRFSIFDVMNSGLIKSHCSDITSCFIPDLTCWHKLNPSTDHIADFAVTRMWANNANSAMTSSSNFKPAVVSLMIWQRWLTLKMQTCSTSLDLYKTFVVLLALSVN